MEKRFIAVAMIMAIVLLPGCKKVYDYIEDHPAADIKICPIMRIISAGQYGPADTLIFKYNSWGDPVSVAHSVGPSTGRPDYVFKYNRSGKLSELLAVYYMYGTTDDGVFMEYWNKYFYDGTGKIARDSTYIWPYFENGVLIDYYGGKMTFYTYDNNERIIKDSTIWTEGHLSGGTGKLISVSVSNYAYDAIGNKVGGSYDQKTSFLRTNKIWMFLHRDYSLNNPFTADTYNSNGLPTSLNLSIKGGGSTRFLDVYFNGAQIAYGCH
jgi:hypothetical protein